MRILVTGAAGFVGSHLSEGLVNLGYEVVGIDNFNNYYDPLLKAKNARELELQGVEIFNQDLNSDLGNLFNQTYDYVYHLAAQPGISAQTTFGDYLSNNLTATESLLQAVLKHNPRLKCFINISTSSVYGLKATVNESFLPKPASYYGVTKLAAEQLVLSYQRLGKLSACSLRLYSVYGPRERPEKLYSKLIDYLYKDKPFPLFQGSESHQRSFTYVGDIVSGLLAVLSKENSLNGEIINLGNGETYTTAQGIAIVEKLMNKKLIINQQPARSGDQEKTAAVIHKAQKLLGYNPQTDLKAGLSKQLEWYLNNL